MSYDRLVISTLCWTLFRYVKVQTKLILMSSSHARWQDLFKMKTERKGKGTGRKKTGKKRKLDADADKEHDDDGAVRPGKYVRVMSEGVKGVVKANNEKEHKNDRAKSKNKDKDRKKSFRDQQQQKGKRAPKKDKAGAEIGEGEGLFHGFRVRKEDATALRNLAKKLNESGMKRVSFKNSRNIFKAQE